MLAIENADRLRIVALLVLALLGIAGCDAETSSEVPEFSETKRANESVPDSNDGDVVEHIRGYWAGIARRFAISPAGNVVGVSCHNCYQAGFDTPAKNLEATLGMLHQAQRAGADLLELDLSEEDGTWYIGHNDDGSIDRATLDDVLADEALIGGDQLLYLEIKEDQEANANRLLELLTSIVDAGYAVNGRDVVLRAFDSRIEQLRGARRVLKSGALSDDARHFRMQVLYTKEQGDDQSTIEVAVAEAANEGFDGVEFNYFSARIFELLSFARSKGLGTNVWTFDRSDGTARCADFRDLTDAVTTDSALDACRAAIIGL